MLQTNSTTVEETGRDWVRAHAALSRLARERAAADAEEGRWLLCALRSAAHVHLGFGSFGEYVERLFGYKPRSTQEKLRVAESLEQLPHLARALDSGSLGWSAVRELTRVVVADTESEWLELAQGKTLRQLEELVAGKDLGDPPSASNPPAPRQHVLRFEVAPETFALFREALLCLRRRSPGPVDDDTPCSPWRATSSERIGTTHDRATRSLSASAALAARPSSKPAASSSRSARTS
jgi:hypothetical protein